MLNNTIPALLSSFTFEFKLIKLIQVEYREKLNKVNAIYKENFVAPNQPKVCVDKREAKLAALRRSLTCRKLA